MVSNIIVFWASSKDVKTGKSWSFQLKYDNSWLSVPSNSNMASKEEIPVTLKGRWNESERVGWALTLFCSISDFSPLHTTVQCLFFLRNPVALKDVLGRMGQERKKLWHKNGKRAPLGYWRLLKFCYQTFTFEKV